MSILKHEVWREPDGLTALCLSDYRGNDCRSMLGLGSTLIHTFEAGSHFDAMSVYYQFMEWGRYETEFQIDKEPYDDGL